LKEGCEDKSTPVCDDSSEPVRDPLDLKGEEGDKKWCKSNADEDKLELVRCADGKAPV